MAFAIQAHGNVDEARRLALSVVEEAPDDGEARAFAMLLLSGGVPKWHWNIVRDDARNEAYDAAIRRAVAAGARRFLDIGSGTGLLAMMAARAGAQSVVSCEMNVAVAEQAAAIVRHNGLDDRVRVVARRSQDLVIGEHLDAPVDVVVSEIVSNNMFGQDILDVHKDAVARLLKPGGLVIPAVGSVMAMLAHVDGMETRRMGVVSGFDLSLFDPLARPSQSMHVNDRRIAPRSEAVEVMRFPFADPTQWPVGVCRIPVTAAGGKVNAIVSWIRLDMDGSGMPGAVYENRPTSGASSCWAALVHSLPKERQGMEGEAVVLAGCRFGREVLFWCE